MVSFRAAMGRTVWIAGAPHPLVVTRSTRTSIFAGPASQALEVQLRDELIKKATAFFTKTTGKPGTLEDKLDFLRQKGLTEDELVVALAAATEALEPKEPETENLH